jgi:hypothetical protein
LSDVVHHDGQIVGTLEHAFEVPFVAFIARVGSYGELEIRIDLIQFLFDVFDQFIVFSTVIGHRVIKLFNIHVDTVQIVFVCKLGDGGSSRTHFLGISE